MLTVSQGIQTMASTTTALVASQLHGSHQASPGTSSVTVRAFTTTAATTTRRVMAQPMRKSRAPPVTPDAPLVPRRIVRRAGRT